MVNLHRERRAYPLNPYKSLHHDFEEDVRVNPAVAEVGIILSKSNSPDTVLQ